MRIASLLLATLPGAAAAQGFTTPSGLDVTIAEVMVQEEGRTVRLRLLAPVLGQAGAGYDEVAQDFVWICEAQVLPALADNGLSPGHVVISIADRPVPFGEVDGAATQFFEGFDVVDGTCAWALH